jgi:hypothetical protein
MTSDYCKIAEFFLYKRNENIKSWFVFDKNLIFRCESICCILNNKSLLMLFIWVNDEQKIEWRSFTRIVKTIDYYV